jgi:Nucleotidyl transferase AbiEii toxin, Type IV TA system
MTATEMYDSVTNGGASDFAEVVAVLNRYKPWCLIGGLAVNCYVEPVYTVDVDLVVVAANLERIGRELEPAGFRVKKFEHSMNAQRSGSKLNVQFTTDPRYQEFLDGAMEHEVLGMPVPVASLKDIVRGKVWAWQDEQRRSTKRKKDELDLMRIAEAHPELRPLIPAEIVKQL